MNFRERSKISIGLFRWSSDFSGNFRNAVVFLALSSLVLGCRESSTAQVKSGHTELHTLIDSAPASLNPRVSLDAIGQRLELLAFRGLTQLDPELETRGDLSEKWRFEDGGKKVRFILRKGVVDHRGRPIDSVHLLKCMQNVFFRKPTSPFSTSFPTLEKVSLEKDDLIFHLSAPDPYLPKNISTVRYFSFEESDDEPCRDPKPGEKIVTNGLYSVNPYPERIEREMRFISREPDAPDLIFELVRDETSRLLKLLNGEADFALNSFSPRKTDWLISDPKRGFKMVERNGTSSSYLAFNLRDPILGNVKVRQAIAHAINRDQIVRFKLKNASVASSLLLSSLPEALPEAPFVYDPKLSETLLDEGGFPLQKDGTRFSLKYKTTTGKEGLELGQIYRESLGKIGIMLDLEPVEPAVFFASIRKGNFQMYMSRWVGLSDGSIFHRTLNSKSKDNRVGYKNAEIDALTEASLHEIDLKKRREILLKVQKKMLEDLPYFPLWHWTNAIVFRDTLTPPTPESLSLAGSYVPLSNLRFRKDAPLKK